MSWKQFLKPDWRKIGLFLLFFVFLWFLLLPIESLFTEPGSDCIGCRAPDFLIIITRIFSPFGSGTFSLVPDNLLPADIPTRANILIILTLLTNLIWYFLSCLIVWIYDKFRKKKEDYVHIKDVNMVMGQLEKWGKKKKK